MPTPRRSPPPRRHGPKPPPPTRQRSGGREQKPRRGPASCGIGRRGIALGQQRWRWQPESRSNISYALLGSQGNAITPVYTCPSHDTHLIPGVSAGACVHTSPKRWTSSALGENPRPKRTRRHAESAVCKRRHQADK